MPLRQGEPTYKDQPHNASLHAAGTKGRDARCTIPGCNEPPIVSRHWQNPAYSNGWWGSYCANHLAKQNE